ncbi:AcvB/VirJ family lysyl-phosphatidylglycerol hydrolase [Nevskia sp.]|uniref:AcvB/VirJ family lysyl-phosphatidylglycerol hydrolase n=1 Tax=Nevskia sp. TaxID=1929292 RepID=UPI0025D0A450|nr:AcvB/VirJ family lysyl-phosphatidylglycerol hydrolase [Nevskia sp.]
MKPLVIAAAAAFLSLSSQAAEPAAAVPAVEALSHGRFDNVRVHRPAGTPKSFVLFLSGDGGWTTRERGGAAAMVAALVADGAMVAAIDTPRLLSAFEADGGDCVYAVGDFENLSHFVQAWAHLPTYLTPILAGHAAGATLAYGVLAQAEKGSFTGAVTTAFCPDLNLAKPFCAGLGVKQAAPSTERTGIEFLPTRTLSAPWVSLHGDIDQVCPVAAARSFVADLPNTRLVTVPGVGHAFGAVADWRDAYHEAVAGLETTQTQDSLPPPPGALNDLPVIEVEASGPAAAHADTFAILVSGDGGWAGIDKDLAAHLAAAGMPVVGVDSLRYFWSERTPDGFAADLERIVRHYRQKFDRPRVLLIGYSQGADVLPFALNRLPAATRRDLALVALLGLAERAQFEFHLSSWVGTTGGGLPTRPEVARLQAAPSNPPLLCVWGEEDEDAICGSLTGPRLSVLKLPGGHHFDGDYEALAIKLLAAIPPAKLVKR